VDDLNHLDATFFDDLNRSLPLLKDLNRNLLAHGITGSL
jgi:hypothetical protein